MKHKVSDAKTPFLNRDLCVEQCLLEDADLEAFSWIRIASYGRKVETVPRFPVRVKTQVEQHEGSRWRLEMNKSGYESSSAL